MLNNTLYKSYQKKTKGYLRLSCQTGHLTIMPTLDVKVNKIPSNNRIAIIFPDIPIYPFFGCRHDDCCTGFVGECLSVRLVGDRQREGPISLASKQMLNTHEICDTESRSNL